MADENGGMGLGIFCLTLLFATFGGILLLALRMSPEGRGKLQRAGDREEDSDDDGVEQNNERRENRRRERRADAEARREMVQQREERWNEKQELYNQRQRDKEEARLKVEDAEKKLREEKEQKEQEEFLKWKAMFTVEAEGDEDADVAEGGAVERFVEYIKVRKVVNLEELAADFHMKTSAAIDRLKELERISRITGIFDDRGKFVYLTVEEMTGVANWLKGKGRINRADLVAACNRIVRMNPTEEDKAKLQQEAVSAVDALEKDEGEQ